MVWGGRARSSSTKLQLQIPLLLQKVELHEKKKNEDDVSRSSLSVAKRKKARKGYLVHGEGWSVGGSDQASLCGFQHLLEAA